MKDIKMNAMEIGTLEIYTNTQRGMPRKRRKKLINKGCRDTKKLPRKLLILCGMNEMKPKE